MKKKIWQKTLFCTFLRTGGLDARPGSVSMGVTGSDEMLEEVETTQSMSRCLIPSLSSPRFRSTIFSLPCFWP